MKRSAWKLQRSAENINVSVAYTKFYGEPLITAIMKYTMIDSELLTIETLEYAMVDGHH